MTLHQKLLRTFALWVYNLVKSLIGGAFTGLTGAVIDPAHLNTGDGWNSLKTTALAGVVSHAVVFFVKSPLPKLPSEIYEGVEDTAILPKE